MAIVQMNFESQYLACRHPVTMILPDLPRSMPPKEFYQSGKKFKVLWLLHGTFGNDTDWLRRTMIEVYACERNLAVVLPSGMNADYVNWKGFGLGYNMFDYLFEELMPMVYNWYPISDRREDNLIAGLSMGGFGTMVYALNHPEKFAVAASLSGPILDPHNPMDFDAGMEFPHMQAFRANRLENQIANAGGMESYLRSPANTWDKLLESAKSGVDLPELYFCCGTNDFLYPAYLRFKEFAEENQIPAVFEEEPGYRHEWRFWDLYIQKIIDRYVPKERIEGLSF